MIRSKAFRLVNLAEQKSLPEEVREWIDRSKRKMGLDTYSYGNKRLYLISLGERPNPGHKIELIKAEESRQRIIAEVKETPPAPGGFYPMVLAYPYLVAEVEKPIEVNLTVEWPNHSTFSLKSL